VARPVHTPGVSRLWFRAAGTHIVERLPVSGAAIADVGPIGSRGIGSGSVWLWLTFSGFALLCTLLSFVLWTSVLRHATAKATSDRQELAYVGATACPGIFEFDSLKNTDKVSRASLSRGW